MWLTLMDRFTPRRARVRVVSALRVWAVAERGAIPYLLDILSEVDHPWSIKEAAAQALELLAQETAGGPAQESITEHGGVTRILACYRSEGCTHACKEACARALRFLAVYKEAKAEMAALGILLPREQSSDSDIVMPGLETMR